MTLEKGCQGYDLEPRVLVESPGLDAIIVDGYLLVGVSNADVESEVVVDGVGVSEVELG